MPPLTSPLFAVLAFRGWFPVWLAVLLGLAAAAGAVWLYLREPPHVPLWRRLVLAMFRVLALSTILFLVLRPTIVTDTHGTRPRPIAVLADDSQSMTTADPRPGFADRWRVGLATGKLPADAKLPAMPSAGDLPPDLPERPTRLDVAKAALSSDKLKLLDRLKKVGPLQPAAFGVRRSAKDPRSLEWVTALAGKEPKTALADAVADLLKRDENELPAAVVVVTDGRDNSSDGGLDAVARECARLGVPLHVYGVGSSSFGQAQIRDVPVAETLFVDDTVAVPVRYKVSGFKDGQVEIAVRLRGPDGQEGKEVARKVVDVRDGDDLRETLTFVPNKADAENGKQELVTTLRVLSGGEVATDELTKSVRVVDRKMKVLVVDSIPRWDFKFLQRALLRDRRVEATFYLTDADPRAMKAGAPFLPAFPSSRPDLFAYDLLILGDVAASSLTNEQQGFVRDFVAEGGGLVHIAGKNHGPASFVGTPLADVLPVEIPVARFPVDDANRPPAYRPVLTPAGVRSPVLVMDENPVESLRVWKTLPEMYWSYPVKRLKPAAEAYLVHPTEKGADGKPMPLMAAHYYGKGYAVYLGFDETWRWRFNEADKFFGRFWTQAVYVTGVSRTTGTKLTQLSLDTPDPQLGKVGQVYARLFTPDLKPLTTNRIEARAERLDVGPDDKDRFTPVELKALPGQPGEYVATVPFNRVGRFALRVDAGTDPASLEYRVALPPDHELSPGGMAEGELRKLAELSGGGFYREENLNGLPDAVKPKAVPYTQREEILLWNKWLMLWLLGLLGAEWFLRKFNSLS